MLTPVLSVLIHDIPTCNDPQDCFGEIAKAYCIGRELTVLINGATGCGKYLLAVRSIIALVSVGIQ